MKIPKNIKRAIDRLQIKGRTEYQYNDLKKVLEHFGFIEQKGGDRSFINENGVIINTPIKHGSQKDNKKVKGGYVKRAIPILEEVIGIPLDQLEVENPHYEDEESQEEKDDSEETGTESR